MPLSRKQTVTLVVALAGVVAVAAAMYLYEAQWGQLAGNPLPDLVAQLPPDAPVIAYLDLASLRKLEGSPLATLLGLATEGPNQDREYQEFVRDTGFDYERDLDRAALAFWPPKAKLAPTSQGQEILAIASGRFNQAKIEAYALRSHGVLASGQHSIYRVPGNPAVSFEFLSATRIVLASGPNAEAHLMTANSRGGLDASDRALINHVSGAPVFAVARADALPESIYAALGQSPQVTAMVKNIQGFTFAAQPDAMNLDAVLDAECDSPASALEISTLLGGFRIFGSLALSSPKKKGGITSEQAAFLSNLLAQVQIRQQESWVRVSLTVTPAMLSGAASSR